MQVYPPGAPYNDLLDNSAQEERLIFEIYEEGEEIKREDTMDPSEKFTFTSIIEKIQPVPEVQSVVEEAPPYKTNKSHA